VPNSFSRFLNEEEIAQVKELYLASLAELDADLGPPQAEPEPAQPKPTGDGDEAGR
jgi:hypothetical protein